MDRSLKETDVSKTRVLLLRLKSRQFFYLLMPIAIYIIIC